MRDYGILRISQYKDPNKAARNFQGYDLSRVPNTLRFVKLYNE